MTQVTDRLSSSVAEVAAHSANFGFLLPHQPLLVLCGAEAEVSIFAAPTRSLERSREFGQILATDLLHRAGMTPLGDSQAARLQALMGLPGQSRAEHQPREEQRFAGVQTRSGGRWRVSTT